MSAVVLASGIYPPEIGGPATYVERLARTLDNDGVTVAVVATTPGASVDARPGPGWSVSLVTRRQPVPLRMLRVARTLARRSRGASVIYANGSYLEALAASRWGRVALAAKIVGDYSWEVAYNRGHTQLDVLAFQSACPPVPSVRAIRRLQSLWCTRADRILAGSRFMAALVRGWGVPAEKVVVIPNAVEVPAGQPRFARGLPTRRLSAITGGRLIGWKGFDLLIRMLAGVADMTLTIVGSGSEHPRLVALAESLGVGDRVRFVRSVAPGEMAELYREHDVFLLASTSDTFSYMTIEAMASGLPVVVSDRGALPETVGEGRWGLVCSSDRVEEWTEAVERLRGEPALYRGLGEAGYQAAREVYDWKSIYPRTMAFLAGEPA